MSANDFSHFANVDECSSFHMKTFFQPSVVSGAAFAVFVQFSVSFPSGIRRASSLTPSLEVRLGPPAPSPPTGCRDTSKIGYDDSGDGSGAEKGDVSRKLR